jgi:hypothetical protein
LASVRSSPPLSPFSLSLSLSLSFSFPFLSVRFLFSSLLFGFRGLSFLKETLAPAVTAKSDEEPSPGSCSLVTRTAAGLATISEFFRETDVRLTLVLYCVLSFAVIMFDEDLPAVVQYAAPLRRLAHTQSTNLNEGEKKKKKEEEIKRVRAKEWKGGSVTFRQKRCGYLILGARFPSTGLSWSTNDIG